MLPYMSDESKLLARAIGERVKRDRQARSWTLDQLAVKAGVSRRMVVSVEQGAVNPSVGTLLRLSDALGIGLPALVEPPASPGAANVTKKGEGAVLWTGDHGGLGVLVSGTEPPDVVELWDWSLGPGDRHQSEAHANGTRELLHVRAGALRVETDGSVHDLATGDALSFRGDTVHSYSNPYDTITEFALTVFQPGVGGPKQRLNPNSGS